MRAILSLPAAGMLLLACNSANGPTSESPASSWSVPESLVMEVGTVETIVVSVLNTEGDRMDDFYLEWGLACGPGACSIAVTDTAPPEGRRDGTRRFLQVRALEPGQAEIRYRWPAYECADPPMCYVKRWYTVIPEGRTRVTVVGAP